MKRKPLSGLARLLKSHLRLLRVQRGQIQELGELRKAILDMRQSVSILRRMAQETRELMAQRPAPQEFDVPPGIIPRCGCSFLSEIKSTKYGDYICGKCGGMIIVARPNPPNDWPRL